MSDFEFWKDLGNIFEAVLSYQKRNAEFNNQFINPWIRIGNVFDKQDRKREAIDAYRNAVEIDPGNPAHWADLGDACFKAEKYEEAAEAYQQAVNLDPQAGWPVSNLALTFAHLGRYAESVPLYLTGLELLTDAKDRAIVWNRLGNAYRKLNDYENAFLAFQKADELDSDNTGFKDALDETPEEQEAVAPSAALEEVLVNPPDAEVLAVDSTGSTIILDLPGEPVAIAPNTEMIVEEAPVIEAGEPAAKAESAEEEINEPLAVEAQEEMPEAASESEVAVEEAQPKVTEPAAEEENASADEDAVEAEGEPIMADDDEDLPEWLAGQKQAVEDEQELIIEESGEPTPIELHEHFAAIPEAAAESSEQEAIAATPVEDAVETITESLPLEVQPEAVAAEEMEPALVAVENESVEVPAAESESTVLVEDEAGGVDVDPVVMEETALQENPVEAQRQPAAESISIAGAYDEFLRDAAQPVIAAAHVEDDRLEKVEAKINKSGEVSIELDTENPHVWNELGNVYLKTGSIDEAIAAYRRAIDLDKNFAWPYSNLALAYVHKLSFVEAILFYERSIELFTNNRDKAITWNRLGNVYRRLNDYEKAIQAYQTADELDPGNATLSLRANYGLLGSLQEQKASIPA